MLKQYWPDAERVNECIKNEAETADEAVLLAVHQPSPLLRRAAGSGLETPASEQDLLEAFLASDVPGGALLLPITGPSGVGKSHIIRWLDAQLRRSAARERLHIIRIPKSASLRAVVELILAPLSNHPEYEGIRAELSRAVAEVNVASAVVTFRAHLENALAVASQRLLEEVQRDPSKGHLRAMVGHARDLPKLFADAALSKHFADTVLSRVISRALRGQSAGEEENETLSQFVAEDLELPSSVPLGEAAAPVRQYYMGALSRSDSAERRRIVELLNSVVDGAIARVFQIEQSTNGMTLQDIILAVRELLLREGRDLVLLVEDFAALAGIQEALLKVCIQEGVYEGRKVRATMRTAIALTDGYLAFRDTILTRAQREWLIGGKQLSDNEIKDSVVDLVGGYVDAARWGGDELRRRFAMAAELGRKDWLPAWSAEDLQEDAREALESFGRDSQGRALFPFNRNAILRLVEIHLADSGRLTFNPRRVINEILRAPLLMRGAFEQGNFPPGDFAGVAANVFVANWLRATRLQEGNRRRLASLLMVWGGAPTDEKALSHLPPQLFTAFALQTPFDLQRIEYVPKPQEPTAQPSRGAEEDPKAAVEDGEHIAWRKKLDDWVAGIELGQRDAASIRKALRGLLKASIDWGAMRMREQEVHAAAIFIPNARGNQAVGLQLKVSEDATDENGAVRLGILGALRFERMGGNWNYAGADDDYVATSALIDLLGEQLRPHLLAESKRQIAALSGALIVQARIGGLAPPLKVVDEQALPALFAPIEAIDSKDESWRRIVEASVAASVGQKPARKALQDEVFARIGSFQGAGPTIHAIDCARLVDALADPLGEDANVGFVPDLSAYLRQSTENRLWSPISDLVGRLQRFKRDAGMFADPNFDKQAFVDDLQAIARLLVDTGSWNSSLKLAAFQQQVRAFQSASVRDFMERVERVLAHADRANLPRLLNELGRMDFALSEQLTEFLRAVEEVIRVAEQASAQAAKLSALANPDVIAGEILATLRAVEGDLFSTGAADDEQ